MGWVRNALLEGGALVISSRATGPRRLSWSVLLVVWAAFIFTLSSLHGGQLPKIELSWLEFVVKKTAHLLLYAIFALLAERTATPVRGAWLWAWLLAVAYALSDEWHQSFVVGREATVRDLLIDAAGAAGGLAARAWLWSAWNARRPALALRRGPRWRSE